MMMCDVILAEHGAASMGQPCSADQPSDASVGDDASEAAYEASVQVMDGMLATVSATEDSRRAESVPGAAGAVGAADAAAAKVSSAPPHKRPPGLGLG